MGNRQVFLATTALEEFWDTASPLLFLGEWCLLYERRQIWEPLDGKCLESPYNSQVVCDAYGYLREVYERILPVLGNALNDIHGTNYSSRFWRIVIGPWLNYYLVVTYDRYLHIRMALEQYPDLKTLVLPEACFVTPGNTLDFNRYAAEDSFNLQIVTKIFAALGKSFPSRYVEIAHDFRYDISRKRSWKYNILNFCEKTWLRAGSLFVRPVILKDSHFSTAVELSMMPKLPFGISWDRRPDVVQADIQYNHRLRKMLPDMLGGEDEYEICLGQMLRSDIPLCFVEGFGHTLSAARKAYPKRAKAIFSTTAWYHNEMFKFWAAEMAEKGTPLLGAQHGGNYGSLAYMSFEDHETAITDRYYTWGWKRNGCHAEVIAMPAIKFIGRPRMQADNRQGDILWGTTALPRYLLLWPHIPKNFSLYLDWQRQFADALTKEIRNVLRIRPHPQDYGWNVAARLCENFPDIRTETAGISFMKSLKECRLYVCDHLSTTFTEAMAVGKPTILFWNPEANVLKQNAQPYYDLLRKSGILFNSPEQAADAVNCICDDVESWWNQPERQAAVATFCEQFARHYDDAAERWIQELKNIADAPPPADVDAVNYQ